MSLFPPDRSKLYNANEKISKVLVEMLRSVIATEELIGQKISTRIQRNEQMIQKSSTENKDQESGWLSLDLSPYKIQNIDFMSSESSCFNILFPNIYEINY